MNDSLAAELDRLPDALKARLAAHHFDRDRLLALGATAGAARDNRVRGRVEPPAPADLLELPDPASPRAGALRALGLEKLRAGKVALCVLAGGMATRMGGVVKALVDVTPGRTFLDVRLAEQAALTRRAGRPVALWLMTSAATDAAIRSALSSHPGGSAAEVFAQHLSLRLTPDGSLFRGADGAPSEHAPGHGDLVDALRESGLLERFVAAGGETVVLANLDNLGATLDALLVGLHAEGGRPVTCEVVDKLATDRGGIPVRLDGRTVVLEEFRLPAGFDPAQVRVFSTNTFLLDARALLELRAAWSWFVVTKDVDGRPALQQERLIGEVTSFLDTRFVRVPRLGAASRFLPVKDAAELAARRAEIEAVLTARELAS